MNKTVSVNIGGFAFIIEDEAYEILQSYLSKVKSKFVNDQAEIMMDIEARIAELLKDRLAGLKEVVDEEDVKAVIEIMGQPEDYAGDESEEIPVDEDKSEEGKNVKRKLFRDRDNEVISGVCSGLAKYFNIDAVVVRALFVLSVLFLGTGLLLYIILIIVIPEAKTTSDKLKMNGEPVNLDSLKSHFSNISHDINDNLKEKNIGGKVNSIVNSVLKVVVAIAKALSKVVGVALIVAGVIGLFFMILYVLGNKDVIPLGSVVKADSFYDILQILYSSSLMATIAMICIVIVIVIPLISFVYTGFRLVFETRTIIDKPIKIGMSILFGIAICLLAVVSIRTGINFSNYGEKFSELTVEEPIGNVLYIEVEEDDPSLFAMNSFPFGAQVMDIKPDYFTLRNVEVHLQEGTDTSNFEIRKIQYSCGINERIAVENAVGMDYTLELRGDTLVVPTYLRIKNKLKYRGQGLEIYITIPHGKRINFGKGTYKLINVINHHRHYYKGFRNDGSFEGTSWYSSPEGIDCVNCD